MIKPDSLRLELDIRRTRVGGRLVPSSLITVKVTGPDGQTVAWTRDSLEEAMAIVGRRYEQFIPSLPETPEEELAALKTELAEARMKTGRDGADDSDYVIPYPSGHPFRSPRLARILREAGKVK